MSYTAETLEPIVVNESKELLVKDFNKEEVGDIAKETLERPKLLYSGTFETGDDEVFALVPFIPKDGLLLFTYGNSYTIIPFKKEQLDAQVNARFPFVMVNNVGAGRAGFISLSKSQDDEGNAMLTIVGRDAEDSRFPEGWGFSLYQIV